MCSSFFIHIFKKVLTEFVFYIIVNIVPVFVLLTVELNYYLNFIQGEEDQLHIGSYKDYISYFLHVQQLKFREELKKTQYCLCP